MARIEPRRNRPPVPTRSASPKKLVDGDARDAAPRPEGPPKFGLAGYDKLHELSRGRETAHWEDASPRDPGTTAREESPTTGPPDPVRPGAKGDHGGIVLPIDAPPPGEDDEKADESAKKTGK